MGVISRFWKNISTGYKLFLDTIQILKITNASNITTIEGGTVTADVLRLKANTINPYPFIDLPGTGSILIQGDATTGLRMYSNGIYYFTIIHEAANNQAKFVSIVANNDLFLETVGTGVIKFGTEITNAGSDRGKLVKFKLADGTSVYLKTYDTV